MFTSLRALCVLCLCFTLCMGDTYMHLPRGSNNRLNERSANRNNANRLFDSQNNNRGGYNAGDTDETDGFNTEEEIYNMRHFMSSESANSYLTIEWTNQHGCGGNENNDPHKLNCNMVIQYMVEDSDATEDDQLRNGVNTNTPNYQQPSSLEETLQQFTSRKSNQINTNRGLHETFDYYDDCYVRERNRGLFTADQNLRNNNGLGVSSAIYTRQNPNGNRRGYECPEERDHYPYWHPSPWRDIAVLTDNTSHCDWYVSESTAPKGICKEVYPGTNVARSFSQWNNRDECEIAGGDWFLSYPYIDIESVPEADCTGDSRVWAPANYGENSRCLVLAPPVDCQQVGWTRVNHLGNGRDGVPLNYTWTIPYFPSQEEKKIIIRIRYNISTDDYDPYNTNSSHNQNLGAGIRSPVTQNPYINIGSTTNKPLRLAINTAQFGRTFQDRSHIIRLMPRSLITAEGGQTCELYNLNVRGKRGNIVQTFPAVEYDFFPNRMTITEDDCVHIQWTGSNTHNNGNPGGDGQTGDAGEGRSGTDRHNMVEIDGTTENYPKPWEQTTMWDVTLMWKDDSEWPTTGELAPEDIAAAFASGGYYGCYTADKCTSSVETKASLQQLLNNVSPSFSGAVLKFKPGTFNYICSRNNNFTNRSQKGVLRVLATSQK